MTVSNAEAVLVAGRLSLLAATAKEAEDAAGKITSRVMLAREAGASWEEIGDALGVTKQSAWERYVAEWNDYQRAKVRGEI